MILLTKLTHPKMKDKMFGTQISLRFSLIEHECRRDVCCDVGEISI